MNTFNNTSVTYLHTDMLSGMINYCNNIYTFIISITANNDGNFTLCLLHVLSDAAALRSLFAICDLLDVLRSIVCLCFFPGAKTIQKINKYSPLHIFNSCMVVLLNLAHHPIVSDTELSPNYTTN